MDREQILQRFETLRQWGSRGERAPHKPLLVLYAIGKLLRGEDRLISYVDDIEENLGNLLREFGPRRDRYNPQFPFWRLQNDGIWEVTDADRIRQTSSGDAYITDLRNYNVSGGFNENISKCLQNDSALTAEIIQNLLDAHFPASLHPDILRTVGIDLPTQSIDTKTWTPDFWDGVLRAYEYKCAVCGFDVKLRHQPVALEATYIKWSQAGGPDITENGLALCSLHHKLFVSGAFTLSQELRLLVSEYANGSSGLSEWLIDFHDTEIHLPQRQAYYPNKDFTEWHLKEVFKGPYREITEAPIETGNNQLVSIQAPSETEPPVPTQYPTDLTAVEKRIFDAIEVQALHIDIIARTTQLPINQVSSTLLTLELKGIVEQLPGNQFAKVT